MLLGWIVDVGVYARALETIWEMIEKLEKTKKGNTML